ncbi:MAG: cytochrome c oxidase assembly protein [Pseudomonadota bacterium]
MAVNKVKNKKTVLILIVFVVAMFGFGYALVPLYNVLCNITGLNGKTSGQYAYGSNEIDKSRWVTVEFDASKNAHLPWKFYPLVRKVKLHPGEMKRIAYYAENDSGKTMTVQAIPSVTPGEMAIYLKKTECFCFDQQTLKNGEGMDMPMVFHLDPSIPKHIKRITLSYTLFDASKFKQKPSSNTGRIK